MHLVFIRTTLVLILPSLLAENSAIFKLLFRLV